MYKLILVDDEAEILEGLKEVIPFEQYGFTVVGEAPNGVEALKLCERTEPDLIVTDIRMPLMDGLTLCRKARALVPTLKCIILSGYDDFMYTQQAIDIQTLGYMLKPISSVEFIEMLEKTRRSLDEDLARRKDETRLREHFNESLPVLREALLGSLLSSAQVPERVFERAERYGMELNSPYYALALFRAAGNISTSCIEDEELRLFAIRSIIEEAHEGSECGGVWQVFTYGGMVAVLLMLEDDTGEYFASVIAKLDEVRKTARHYLSCTLYVGASAACSDLSHLPVCARQALTALNQCVLDKEEQVLCITDIQRRERGSLNIDEVLLNTLASSIKARDTAQAERTLAELMDAARRGALNPRAWRTYLLEIVMCFIRIASEQSLSWDGLNERLDELTARVVHSCPGVDGAEQALGQLMSELLSAMENSRRTSSKMLATEAERYLQENFAQEDTTLEKLCLHLHISPSYFSMIFKKETKKTFHQYLTDLRMDKALSLLSSGDMKVSQIAQSVGLPDPSYFSYCFKKHFGYPPSRTRNR